MSALSQFGGLKPDTESFLYPDGKRRTAFFLGGTIPVPYKGSCYNIPIRVYLWDTHPYYAPICFVRPTAAMVIKESESVNKEGRVFLPYLNEWRFPGYDLHGLLQVMSMVFQEKCPVFAKGSSSTATSTASPSPATSSATSTPYPTANPAMPSPYPAMNAAGYPAATPYPTAGPQFPSPYVNIPPPVPNHFGGGYPPARPAPHVPSGTLQPEHIRASILSALEDKMRIHLRDHLGTKSAEMASIAQTKKDLQTGQQKIRGMIEELERSNRELTAFIATHESKKAELLRALADAGDGTSGPEIDSVIDATNPLHRQLLNHYAQDLACDDEIYALGQAKIRGALTLSEYLKHVRAVARRQFEHRATMQKCRKVAGLPV